MNGVKTISANVIASAWASRQPGASIERSIYGEMVAARQRGEALKKSEGERPGGW